MDGREFFQRVSDDADLEWLGAKRGETPGDDAVLIGSKKSCSKFSLMISAVQDHSWDELQSVLSGRRMPKVMSQIARIVGYYSNIANWNRSKVAELADRNKGNYGLPELPQQRATGEVAAD